MILTTYILALLSLPILALLLLVSIVAYALMARPSSVAWADNLLVERPWAGDSLGEDWVQRLIDADDVDVERVDRTTRWG